jgi:uncharacterized protein
MHGQFSWYELHTSDPAGAQRFYPAISDWDVQSYSTSPDNPYWMWNTGGAPVAGLMPLTANERSAGVSSNWLPYVDVSNAQETIRRATSLGGRVVSGPQTMAGIGTYATLRDPQGAAFAIIQNERPSPGFDGTNRIGRFSWHELLTTDLDAAYRFYSQLFNWEKTGDFDMGPEIGRYQMYGQRGKTFGGIFKRAGRMAQVPPQWFCYVHVKDARGAADAAVKTGARMIYEPMEVPGGDIVAMVSDPQGAMIAVHQSPPGRPQAAAKTTTKKAVKKAVRAAKKAAKKAVRATRKAVRKAGKKATRRTAKKSARKATRRTARKSAKRATKRPARGGARRATKKSSRRVARRGVRKRKR